LPTSRTISRFWQAEFTPEQRLRQASGAFLALFVGLGLGIYLSVTNCWLLSFLPMSLTLFFLASGLFLLFKAGWCGIVALLRDTDVCRPKSLALALAWGIALCVYLQSSFLRGLFVQIPNIHAYYADPACSWSAMYKLAQTPPHVTPANVLYPAPGIAVCGVGWIEAQGNGPIAAHPYTYSFLNRNFYKSVHRGDMVVVQTAFGHLSAVLYPSGDFIDRIFFPEEQFSSRAITR
jgi:hypothetical protein